MSHQLAHVQVIIAFQDVLGTFRNLFKVTTFLLATVHTTLHPGDLDFLRSLCWRPRKGQPLNIQSNREKGALGQVSDSM